MPLGSRVVASRGVLGGGGIGGAGGIRVWVVGLGVNPQTFLELTYSENRVGNNGITNFISCLNKENII